MKLTGTFHLDAAVNKGARRIIGQIVPYGEVGNPGLNGQGIRLEIHAGGLTWDPEDMPKLRSTHHTEPIGRAVTLDESPSGLVAAFSVAKTTAGDDALTLAAEGLQAGLSIEADAPDGITADADGVYRLTADNPAPLTAIALVEVPAFASAQVSQVAAKESVMAEKVTAAEVPDEALTGAIESLTNVVTALSASLAPAEEAPMEAAQALPTRRLTATTSVTREPFPYGHPGAEGQSFFKDQLTAKSGDTFAAARLDKAQDMWGQVAAADEAGAMGDVTIPNVYDDALLVKLPEWPRDIADNLPGTSISSARPVLVPRFDSFLADGGAGEPVTAHSENTNPTSAEIDVDYATYTPALYSGKIDISREAVDAGSPGMDALLFSALRRSYNNVTDLAAYTAIVGFAGIDTGSSTTDASPTVEAQNMVSTIVTEMGNFKGRAGYPANIIWANSAQFANMTGLNATDGRPILPYVNPQNTVGAGSLASFGTVPINGVPMYNAVNVAATKVVLASTAGLHKWESPLLSFRWEEVAGPAKIRFVAAGYFLGSVLDKNAVSLITQA